MTAFGLAVAIPAVLGYNALTRSNKSVINTLNRFVRQLHAYFLTGSPVTQEAANVMPLRGVLRACHQDDGSSAARGHLKLGFITEPVS